MSHLIRARVQRGVLIVASAASQANNLRHPADWAPLGSADERDKCRGGKGNNDFFGHGLVSASAATGG